MSKQKNTLHAIEEEFKRLDELAKANNWFDPRNPENYILSEIEYSFGKRSCYKIPKEKYDLYKDLQASRGLNQHIKTDVSSHIEEIRNEASNFPRNAIDIERAQEIDKLFLSNSTKVFVELGFRTPMLLEHYQKKYKTKVKGYDVVPVNVMVAKYLNYDVNLYDLNLCKNKLKIPKGSVVAAYHVFEHLSDPLRAIKKVYESLSEGSFFHIEVPVEELSAPNLRYAHLFPFHKRDLYNMLTEAGFTILESNYGNSERHLAYKK